MPLLNLHTSDGPAQLNLRAHASTLNALFQLAAGGVHAQATLPATRGQSAAPGLLTAQVEASPDGTLPVTLHVTGGQVLACGVPVTPAMLRYHPREEPGHLHTCTLCHGLTEAEDRVCSACASSYSHWITQGGTCPTCAEVRLVRRIHEGSCSGWEECHACAYTAEIEPPEEHCGAA